MSPENRHRWVRMVLCCTELTAAQKTVLIALETFADFRTGTNAHPGEENLAAMTGLTPRAVRMALKQGRDIGLIVRTSAENPKAHKAAVYRLSTPAESASTTGTAVPVDNSTTGTTIPMEAATTGTAMQHHRNGHVTSTGTAVPPTPHASPNYQVGVSDWGTSPEQLLAAPHTDRVPSRFCDLHPQGYRGSCGPCGNARTAFNAWQAERAAADVAIAAAEDRERKDRRRRAAACGDCDIHGRVEVIDDSGNHALAPCEHPNVPRIENAS